MEFMYNKNMKERMEAVNLTDVDVLLKEEKYDIYRNPSIQDEDIKKLAACMLENKDIDLEQYFDLLKCDSKFCWLNFLGILEAFSKEDRVKGFPLLFLLLQDSNWPTYDKTMELLESMGKEVLLPHFKKYWDEANKDEDEMWIDNLLILAKRMDIEIHEI